MTKINTCQINFLTETNRNKRANFNYKFRRSHINPLIRKLHSLFKKKKFDTKNENYEYSSFKKIVKKAVNLPWRIL